MEKKNVLFSLFAFSLLMPLCSCGSNSTSQESQNSTSVSEKVEEYTIRYMKNDGSNEVYKEETVKMKPSQAYINTAPAAPSREGYRFAGWQTKENVTATDLIHGASPYQWCFGSKLSTTGKALYAKIDNASKTARGISAGTMLIDPKATDHVLTLYARWSEPTYISTSDDLQNMRNDLNGWYILNNDIDLSHTDFEPIGTYFCNYEYYDTSWWSYAFQGRLDGNGYTIKGLNLSKATYNKDYKNTKGAVWNDDGTICNGNAALFSAVSSGEFNDLKISDFNIDVNYSGDFCYVASLAAFDMGSTLKNVTAENIKVKLTADDNNQQFRSGIFLTVGGLEAGSWSTTVINCSVKGNVEIESKNVSTHGGEIYLGGMFGENYSASSNVKADVDVKLNHEDVSTASSDLALNVNVGGLGGAATGVHPYDADGDYEYSAEEIAASSSKVTSAMDITVKKPNGESEVAVGGVGGAKRYDLVQYTDINSTITLNTELDSAKGKSYVGTVAGRIDVYYLLQILCYTNENKAGSMNNTSDVTCNSQKITTPIEFIPEGLVKIVYEGKETDAIINGNAAASTYSCEANIAAIIEKYGSYVSKDSMSSGIILIYNEE